MITITLGDVVEVDAMAGLFIEGKRWRRRDRVIMTIYKVLSGIDQPIIALTPEKTIIRYTEDGFVDSKDMPHEHDLISPTEMLE
jgi:hypothetical protein